MSVAAIVEEYFSGQRAYLVANVRRFSLFTMPFSFSFRFAVPGLVNPFATQSVFTSNHGYGPRARPEPKPEPVDGDSSWVVPAPAYPHRPLSPTPSSSRARASPSPAPISRKRGWVPSTSEPSQATIMNTSTSGFLDTPSKYRELVESQDSSDEVVVGELSHSKFCYFVPFDLPFHFRLTVFLSFHPHEVTLRTRARWHAFFSCLGFSTNSHSKLLISCVVSRLLFLFAHHHGPLSRSPAREETQGHHRSG